MENNHHDKRRRALIIALTIPVFIAILTMVIVKAGISDSAEAEYNVTDLDLRVAVSKDQTFQVEMFLSVDLPRDLRRIGFCLPGSPYPLKELTVEGKKVRPVKKSSGNYAEIRDPELLTEGHHRYRITYRLTGQAEKDLFRFEVLPAGWKKPIERLHVLMWFPNGFPLGEIRPETERPADITKTIKIEPQSRSYTIVVRRMPADHRLSLEAVLPDGYWE